jgi:hypothetical protein
VSEFVAMESTGPVTVETKELDPIPMFMDMVEVDMVKAWVDTEPESCEPRMIELVSPSGEQPTKEGAVSLTVAHSWILNNIASRELSDQIWKQLRSGLRTLLVRSITICRQTA